MNVVWLCTWYPNKYDRFTGDFIQRQAQALSHLQTLHVVHIYTDALKDEYEYVEQGQLHEHIYYLKKRTKLLSWLHYLQLHLRCIKQLQQSWPIELVHVHVPFKSGIVALLLQQKYRLPFLVSEHYGIYDKQVQNNFYSRAFLFKFMLKRTLRRAAGCIVVSRYLGEGMKQVLGIRQYRIIPNCVNTELFYPEKKANKIFKFIHASGMDDNKNVEGIILACALLMSFTDVAFELHCIGAKPPKLLQLAADKLLLDRVLFFHDAMPHDQFATELRQADAFVLFSKTETQSCVILESLCCGVPVISSKVGGAAELLNESNGVYVNEGNSEQLAKAMYALMKNYTNYKGIEIANAAKLLYENAVIAGQLQTAYQAQFAHQA